MKILVRNVELLVRNVSSNEKVALYFICYN